MSLEFRRSGRAEGIDSYSEYRKKELNEHLYQSHRKKEIEDARQRTLNRFRELTNLDDDVLKELDKSEKMVEEAKSHSTVVSGEITTNENVETFSETQAFSPETQKLLDEADSVLTSNHPDMVIEYEEVKQNEQDINDTRQLSDLSLEQLEELSKTGKVQPSIAQNIDNKHL